MPRKTGPRKFGLDRGRTTGFYLTLRHEALIAAIGESYSARRGRRTTSPASASVVVQLLIEREAKRLKLPEPEAYESASPSEPAL